MYDIRITVEDSAGNQGIYIYEIEVVDRYRPEDDDTDDDADDDTDGDDDPDDDGADDDEPTDESETGSTKEESPGFSLFLVVMSIGFLLLIVRKVKK